MVTAPPAGVAVQGRHPLQATDALGAASTHVGPHAVALIVLFNKYLCLSHGKIAALLRHWFGLSVRPSAVTHALHRAARQATPTYQALCAQVRGSPMVSPDETGWKVAGQLWALATPKTVIYAIQAGRGFPEAAAVLGPDFDGVLVRDGWKPYRQFTQAGHQTCLAHLLHCRDLLVDHPRALWPQQVKTVLQAALAVRDRDRCGAISAHGVAVARGRLIMRLLDLLASPGPLRDSQRVAARLTAELRAVFGFLFDQAIDATNWRAERRCVPPSSIARSPVVIARRVALRLSRFSPASSRRHVCAMSIHDRCWSTCFGQPHRPSRRRSV